QPAAGADPHRLAEHSARRVRRNDGEGARIRQQRRLAGMRASGVRLERRKVFSQSRRAAVLGDPDVAFAVFDHGPERVAEKTALAIDALAQRRIARIEMQRARSEAGDPQLAARYFEDGDNALAEVVIDGL